MLVVAGGLFHGLVRDREHVGRGGEERQREVVSHVLQPGGQRVDRHGQAEVRGTVGVHVVAEDQRAGEVADPTGHGGYVGDQVGAGPPLEGLGSSRAYGDQQRPGPRGRCLCEALPELGAGQVHGGHPSAPAQQGLQRSHLGAGPEHGHRAAVQAQPLGVRHHHTYGVRGGRLEHPLGDPRVETVAQRIAPQPLSVEGQGQLPLRRTGPGDRHRLETLRRIRGRPLREPELVPGAVDDRQPGAERREPGGRDAEARIP